jgi:cobalt-zinc-cadmium efflux system outer membrane protein
LRELLSGNPDVARWDDAVEQRRAAVASARAEAWPDLTLTAGMKRIEELDLYAFVAGFSLPLPLFDRNQGGIDEARVEASRARESRRKALAAARSGFEAAWQALVQASEGAATLREEVLPAARAAFEAADEGYRQGKFGYLDVLDAQETLFETKRQLIEALLTYHTAVADLERLVGRSLGSVEEERGENP